MCGHLMIAPTPSPAFRLSPTLRLLLPFSHRSTSEVQHWRWMIRSGWQSVFQFIPKVLDQVEIEGLRRPTEFVKSKVVKKYLLELDASSWIKEDDSWTSAILIATVLLKKGVNKVLLTSHYWPVGRQLCLQTEAFVETRASVVLSTADWSHTKMSCTF